MCYSKRERERSAISQVVQSFLLTWKQREEMSRLYEILTVSCVRGTQTHSPGGFSLLPWKLLHGMERETVED